MSEEFSFMIDGREVKAKPGETILQAAERAGIYIPRLCYHPELGHHGSCRVCTVKANGRFVASCIQPAAPGMVVECETEELLDLRRSVVEMLFVEGNHFCMFCEKSGNCELQALAYRLGITGPRHPYLFPKRPVDMSHPEVWLDHNRCILCARCVRASRDLDEKELFGFSGRSKDKRVIAGAWRTLNEVPCSPRDKALAVCPVGALLRKRAGYTVPIGERLYDYEPIGTEIELKRRMPTSQKER